MEKRQRLLSSLVVVYIIKFSCLICALFTEYWVDADGYHFGVFKYCVDNTSTCQDVTSQLQTIEGKHFDFDISLHGCDTSRSPSCKLYIPYTSEILLCKVELMYKCIHNSLKNILISSGKKKRHWEYTAMINEERLNWESWSFGTGYYVLNSYLYWFSSDRAFKKPNI